eukprot:TRINITY_DN2795_c0_g3_i4.p1 TRINITY_DN2795_c0_g3~~TRINITY_DN2795_c0_g3_i4.p1  ORF type:complete len:130 (-),score=22.78 TRINITY_DN2795_c0_g3_i4:2-391(-)
MAMSADGNCCDGGGLPPLGLPQPEQVHVRVHVRMRVRDCCVGSASLTQALLQSVPELEQDPRGAKSMYTLTRRHDVDCWCTTSSQGHVLVSYFNYLQEAHPHNHLRNERGHHHQQSKKKKKKHPPRTLR